MSDTKNLGIAKDSFTGTGNGTAIMLAGAFNLGLSGTWAGTMVLERSLDDGVSYETVDTFTENVQSVDAEVEPHVLWRWRCSAYTSGTIVARLAQ